MLKDDLLINKCLAGDKDAFGVLVDRYKDTVYGLAYSKVRNFHDAEDIAQEAFISAYRDLRSLKQPHRFSSWIYAIAANCCRMWLRKTPRELVGSASMDELRKNQEDRAIRDAREQEILDSALDAINGLPESSRLVMTLYYVNGLTCKEIGEFTGASINTVMSKLHRARVELRQEFGEMPTKAMTQRKLPSEFTVGILQSIEHISPVPPSQPNPMGRVIGISGVVGLAISLIIIAGLSYVSPPGELAYIVEREEPVIIYPMDELRGKESGDKMTASITNASHIVLDAEVAEVRDMGPVQFLDVISGRDGGFSTRFDGRSVWVFGDTFLNTAGQDGSRWRSSTWCWTQDFHARDGVGGFDESVDARGAPDEFLPFTMDEEVYNRDHNLNLLPERARSRISLWPGPVVVSPEGGEAYVFYAKVFASYGTLNFEALGSSIALWESPEKPAIRPEVRPGADDPTMLFPKGDVNLGQGALVIGDWLYAYGCESKGLSWPCIVARAKFADALKRDKWEFLVENNMWSKDWRDAMPVMDAAPALSVHWNEYLGKYLAVYSDQLANTISIRTADRPEGPWSRSRAVVECVVPPKGRIWSYAGLAHPEFARDNGKVECFTYYRETGAFTGEIRLVEVSFK